MISNGLLVRVAASAIVVCATVAGSIVFSSEKSKMTMVHELKFPLMLQGRSASNTSYLLPKGTVLYFDKAFPEGFVSYRIYVNVEGIKLESHELADPTRISPLTAFPIDKVELVKLLRDYPLSKEDLAEILKSGQLTKEEIRATLEEFSR